MIGQRNAHVGAVLIAKPRRDSLYFQNFNEKGETAGFSLGREREKARNSPSHIIDSFKGRQLSCISRRPFYLSFLIDLAVKFQKNA